jgi:hypothetical protein
MGFCIFWKSCCHARGKRRARREYHASARGVRVGFTNSAPSSGGSREKSKVFDANCKLQISHAFGLQVRCCRVPHQPRDQSRDRPLAAGLRCTCGSDAKVVTRSEICTGHAAGRKYAGCKAAGSTAASLQVCIAAVARYVHVARLLLAVAGCGPQASFPRAPRLHP